MSGSSSTAAHAAGPAPPTSSPTSVSSERKQALLLEARRERVAWIDGASMPFRSETTLEGKDGDAMAVLRSTRACRSMGSAVDVVETLYGSGGSSPDGEVAQRVRQQLENCVSSTDMKKATSTSPAFSSGHASFDGKGAEESKAGSDDDFASSYRIFLQKLRSPQCAELVVGIKHFVKSFEEMVDAVDSQIKKKKKVASASKDKGELSNGDFGENGETPDNDAEIKQLASSIHKYLNKTFDLIQGHPLWKEKESNGDKSHSLPTDKEVSRDVTRQSLETFVFSKCSKAIWSVLSDGESDPADAAVKEQLAALQFVTPSHLDVPYLSGDTCDGDKKSDAEGAGENEQGSSNETNAWDTALSAPIASLRSIDHQYSPGRMLSHILDVYRGVNDALSSAMDVTEKAKGAMPGADDVLPTLILTVLRAQPRRIVSSLKFVDLFATQEQLRGEAGYAYTNLFGAVQFIQDLDFEQHSDDHGGGIDGTVLKAKGLSISPEEFRAGLERCMLETKKAKGNSEVGRGEPGAADTPPENESFKALQADFTIPVLDVRAARLGGENVDITWAQRWNEQHNTTSTGREDGGYGEGDSFDDANGLQSGEPKPLARPPPLPDGFTRSYTFLSTKPDDVRVSDIPQLLQEYRMLVHTTETLLAERTAKYNSEQKNYVRRMRERLENSATK